jgi:hypothetical protein
MATNAASIELTLISSDTNDNDSGNGGNDERQRGAVTCIDSKRRRKRKRKRKREREKDEEDEEDEKSGSPLKRAKRLALTPHFPQLRYEEKYRRFRFSDATLNRTDTVINGLRNVLRRCFFPNFLRQQPPKRLSWPGCSQGQHQRQRSRCRWTYTPSNVKEGLNVEAQIREAFLTKRTPRHRYARHFMAWAKALHLAFVASQFCLYDERSRVGTQIDFLLKREHSNGGETLLLVELKCGYAYKFRESQGNMSGAMCSVKDSLKNQCFLQLMWMHYVFVQALQQQRRAEVSAGAVEAWLVVLNQTRVKQAKKNAADVHKCAFRLPEHLRKLERRLHGAVISANRRRPPQQALSHSIEHAFAKATKRQEAGTVYSVKNTLQYVWVGGSFACFIRRYF